MAKVIETGIDRLLQIIKDKGKVSVSECADSLGVSNVIADEWASFLEDEGYISKDYKLTKTYLHYKHQDTNQLTEKAKEIDKKKDKIITGAECELKSLENDDKILSTIRSEFDNLRKSLLKDLAGFNIDLKSLGLDKKAKDASRLQKKADDTLRNVQENEGDFKKVIQALHTESDNIKKEKLEVEQIKKSEDELEKKIDEFESFLHQLRELLKKNREQVNITENSLEDLKKVADEIEKSITSTSKSSKKLQAEVESLKTPTGRQKKKIEKALNAFIAKKADIETHLEEAIHSRDELKEEIQNLIGSAKAFKVSSKGIDLQKQIRALEKSANSIHSKKDKYENDLHNLGKKIKKRGIFSFFGK